jgi:hypothetical protein
METELESDGRDAWLRLRNEVRVLALDPTCSR